MDFKTFFKRLLLVIGVFLYIPFYPFLKKVDEKSAARDLKKYRNDPVKAAVMKKYQNELLGYANYNAKQKEFGLGDFIDHSKLWMFLGEVDTGESDLTEEGKGFLKEFYGYDLVGEIVSQLGGLDTGLRTKEEISEWLEQKETYSTQKFIEWAKDDNRDPKGPY